MILISKLITPSMRTQWRPGCSLLAAAALTTLMAHGSLADTPSGWINSDNTTAYTTDDGQLEISLTGLAVSDSVDVLGVREDLFVDNQRLSGDSVDLEGTRLEVHYGISEWLSVFYQDQRQSLDVDLGEISSVSVRGIDNTLNTSSRRAGLKWIFYAREPFRSQQPGSAAALEIATFRNQSDDFEMIVDAINLPGGPVAFDDPRTIAVNDMKDTGWDARLLYSTTLASGTVASFWAGYRDAEASSATGSNISTEIIGDTFNQAYRLDDTYWILGASVNFRLSPRLPVVLGFEHFKRNDLDFSLDPPRFPEQIPGFLQRDATGDDINNVLTAKASWWFTPRLHLSLSTKYFSNQFYGLLPHFNNPLSGSFADEPYGYFGLGLGYSLRGL